MKQSKPNKENLNACSKNKENESDLMFIYLRNPRERGFV